MDRPNAFTTYPALVGSILASLRKQGAQPLTQQQVADAVGVSVSTWSRIETGETALTVEQLAMAASALGASPGAILGAADIKLIELWEKGIATAWQREEADATSLSMIKLTGASLAHSIGAVSPAGIVPSATLMRMTELLQSAKLETARTATDIGKQASVVGKTISKQAGQLTGKAKQELNKLLEKAPGAKEK